MKIAIADDDSLIVESLSTILGAQPDITVVGTASNGSDAVNLYESVRPDILLMDIRMPEGDGLAAGETIIARHADARIVFLTTFSDDEYIVRALRLGASGYLIKQNVRDIAPALRSIMDGQTVLGSEVISRLSLKPDSRNTDDHAFSEEPSKAQAAASPSRASGSKKAVPESSTSYVEYPSAGTESLITRSGTSSNLASSPYSPTLPIDLTEREQRIIELVAEGLDNKEIASTIYISEGTVRNHISTILAKLGLKNRTQIAVYFWRNREKRST